MVKDATQTRASAVWNLLPLCQSPLLESEQENGAPLLVAYVSSPRSGVRGSRGLEMPEHQSHSEASSYLTALQAASDACLSSTCCRDSLAPKEQSCQQGLLWFCSRVVLPRGPTMGATDGPMVSTKQWWGRGPGIVCPKQEAGTELQRTGRAKGLSGRASARTGGCMNCLLPSSLGMPRPAARVKPRWPGQLGFGQTMACTPRTAASGWQQAGERVLEAGFCPSSAATFQ